MLFLQSILFALYGTSVIVVHGDTDQIRLGWIDYKIMEWILQPGLETDRSI